MRNLNKIHSYNADSIVITYERLCPAERDPGLSYTLKFNVNSKLKLSNKHKLLRVIFESDLACKGSTSGVRDNYTILLPQATQHPS